MFRNAGQKGFFQMSKRVSRFIFRDLADFKLLKCRKKIGKSEKNLDR